MVRKAINSFKAGSAPGPSGLRAEHLKEAMTAPAPHLSSRALESITKLVNMLAKGKLPPSVASYFCAAKLFAAVKKQGGYRPITIGNIL